LVIFPAILFVSGNVPGPVVFLVVPGFLLASINLLWIMMILALICTRYRDLSQIVQNITQVAMYVTPIMWEPSRLPSGAASTIMLYFNPFYYLVSVVRDPMLGSAGTPLNWCAAAVMAIVGWTIALLFVNRYRSRITYWL
jgi:lipopolysaccharide transport system permease protein